MGNSAETVEVFIRSTEEVLPPMEKGKECDANSSF